MASDNLVRAGHSDTVLARHRNAAGPTANTRIDPGGGSDGAPPAGHGTAHQVTNVLAMLLPFAGFVAGIVFLWGSLVSWVDVLGLGVAYSLTCVGITVGFHRLLTHRSFATYPAVRYVLAVLGTLAVEGSVIKWVAHHRKHHDFTDEDGDPHSPHGNGSGAVGALRGLWHAHVGWLFNSVGQADRRRYARDLLRDPGIRLIDAGEKPLIAPSLVAPFLFGLAVKGTLTGALSHWYGWDWRGSSCSITRPSASTRSATTSGAGASRRAIARRT
jgi:fatty-acid desaturase